MKVSFVLIAFFLNPLYADDVFRIEIGKDYNRYSNSDLKRRVWELERAVGQLQDRPERRYVFLQRSAV